MNQTLGDLFIGKLSWKRVVRSALLIPVIVYVTLLSMAWLIPDKLIFRPQPSTYRDDASVLKLTTANGVEISAKFYENPAAAFTILFSHGNAEDIGTTEPFIKRMREAGFAVMVFDYQGYGTSHGIATEGNTYADIDAAYRYLTETRKVPPARIIVHGRSVGGGPVLDLASRVPVAAVILESTFTSVSRVLTRIKLIPFDQFENIAKIAAVHCPVMVIHGRDDWTIPFHHGEALFAAANEPKTQLWVDGAGHNNLFRVAGEQYLVAIRKFVDRLPQ